MTDQTERNLDREALLFFPSTVTKVVRAMPDSGGYLAPLMDRPRYMQEGYPLDIEAQLRFVAALARVSWTWTGTSSTEETP